MKICKFCYLCGLLPGCINPANMGQKCHNILAKKYRNIHVCYFPKILPLKVKYLQMLSLCSPNDQIV